MFPKSSGGIDVNRVRRTAVAAGVFSLVTEVCRRRGARVPYPSVAARRLPLEAGEDTSMFLGSFVEVLLVLAVAGTAAELYPVRGAPHPLNRHATAPPGSRCQ